MWASSRKLRKKIWGQRDLLLSFGTTSWNNVPYFFKLPQRSCSNWMELIPIQSHLAVGFWFQSDLSSLLGCRFWTRLLGSWKQVSRSWYVLIRKLWEIKVWFLYLKESLNEWCYMCVLCRILHNPIVFDTFYWWTHVPSVLCGCACRRVYVCGSIVIGLVWVPIQVLLHTCWYLNTL